MNKPILRGAWLPIILTVVFILLDLLTDHFVGKSPGLDWPHLILVVSTLLVSFVLLRGATEAHRRAEAVLHRARAELEVQVRERTAELEVVNDALRASEERAQDLIKHAPAAIYEVDFFDERFISVNDIACQWTGYTEEELLSMSPLDLTDEESRIKFQERIERKLSGESIDEAVEYRIVAKDGRKIILAVHVGAFTCRDGRPESVLVVAHDITERLNMENALRQSEERFRLALKNAPVTVAAQDKDLRFIWAYNQRTVRPADVLGKTDADLFPPDYATRLIALKRQVLETGAAVSEQLWVESGNRPIYLDLYLEPIRNESGEIAGVGIATVDLTERKLAEDAVYASEEKFSTVFHSSPDAISVVRQGDGTFLDVNEGFTRVFGYPRADVVGRRWAEFSSFPAADDLSRIGQLFRDHGVLADYELSVTTRHGVVTPVLLSLMSITVCEEPCFLAIAHDITKRKKAEEGLRQAQLELARVDQERVRMEERQRLARELHDSVSQALYGISLGAHSALTHVDSDRDRAVEALHYVISLAQAGLTEMRALIFELRPESLEIEGLVTALAKRTATLHASNGIEAALSTCTEPEVPLAVKEALYRIAQEALQNTVKHARPNRVDVRLICEPDDLLLEVCDDGIGFDPQALYPGHLGLRSMRERAESVGGTLEIASAPDCGTQIRVHVPIPATEAVRAE
jgi:PAS domain S-box-containing protein